MTEERQFPMQRGPLDPLVPGRAHLRDRRQGGGVVKASRRELLLVEALRPLAALAEHYEDTDASGPAFIQVGSHAPPLKLTGADCHRARRAIKAVEGVIE